MEAKNRINKAYEIAGIILSHLGGKIKPQEEEKLHSWLEESEENRFLFRQITEEKLQAHELQKLLGYNLPAAWVSIQQKTKKKRHMRILQLSKVAAIMMVMLGTAIFFRMQFHTSGSEQTEDVENTIMYGHPVARLTVANGESYWLDSLFTERLPNAVILNGNELVLNPQASEDTLSPVRSKYNELEIPRGGEYKITLADGTWVYLNSDTRLKFPDDFSGNDERVVYLTGEAYFEVAKNEAKPFIVKCGAYDVKVLGTAFNVSNYPDNDYSHTTLKSGKVKIIQGKEETLLKPGQQAKLQHEQWQVAEVNVENYTTWMNENFRFESENVDEILKRIARWYVVDIFYANPSVKNYHFSGYLPRYANIENVLTLLGMTTDIHFEVKGTTVIVGKK